MNLKSMVDQVGDIKREIVMLQSLTQLTHDSMKLSCVCEVEAGINVSQDIANRLWLVSQTLATLETQLESEWEVAA